MALRVLCLFRHASVMIYFLHSFSFFVFCYLSCPSFGLDVFRIIQPISCPSSYFLFFSWFMTRFESSGAHGCGEQWNARDTRAYTGLSLCEDKNPASCVRQLYYDCLGQEPLYPSFYRIRGRVYMEDLVS
jgi:hypothetical protein